jgi:hypothetical protein
MQLATVTRVVDHALGEDGPEKLPTAPQLWALYRDLRASAAPAARSSEPEPACDDAARIGNVALLRCIVRHAIDNKPPIPAALLRKDGPIVAAKNQLVEAFRRLPEDERSPNELRDLIEGAFDRIVQAQQDRAA